MTRENTRARGSAGQNQVLPSTTPLIRAGSEQAAARPIGPPQS